MNFSFSDYIATAALILSCLSLGGSWYSLVRDSVRLRATGKFFPGFEGQSEPVIRISIVNMGRRPAILTSFGGDLLDGGWQSTSLGNKSEGVRLGENERHQQNIYSHDLIAQSPDDVSEFKNFWFQDTLGQRHGVKGSERLIEKLRQSK